MAQAPYDEGEVDEAAVETCILMGFDPHALLPWTKDLPLSKQSFTHLRLVNGRMTIPYWCAVTEDWFEPWNYDEPR